MHWLYVGMTTANPFTWYGEADPVIQQPWFIHFHCTRVTLGVQICFFPHMRNYIVSRPVLNHKLLSLPCPNQFVLFVNLTITKIQRSITQRLLISLFYFVPLIDTPQSSGLKQHNGSLETLSASQLGSWHLVTTPGCLFFFLFRSKNSWWVFVYWWQRTCSRTGRDSCCRSGYKTLALSREAWQINKTKCKIHFFFCWSKVTGFSKGSRSFQMLSSRLCTCLALLNKVFPLTCRLLSFKFSEILRYYSVEVRDYLMMNSLTCQ